MRVSHRMWNQLMTLLQSIVELILSNLLAKQSSATQGRASSNTLGVESAITLVIPLRIRCIQQLFEKQAEQTPDAIAVEYQGQQLTYQ